MAYTIHNFQPNAVLLASQLNEMDAQIATNESSASNAITIATNAADKADDAVSYAEAQTLTTAEQAQARSNINAASMDDITASMKFLTHTLSANAWDSNNEQTASVTGVLAEGNPQLITISPASSSEDAYVASGILCVGQSANALTFKATIVPTTDISVSISIANGVSA